MQIIKSSLITQPKEWPIWTENKDLKKIFDKFAFYSYLEADKFINEMMQYMKEPTIILIEKYSDTNDRKYFFACFDFKFIIIQIENESDTLILEDFLLKHKSEIWYLQNYSISKPELNNDDKIFNLEI